MKFEEFVREVTDEFKEYVSKEGVGVSIEVREVKRLNEPYTGLCVKKDDSQVGVTINLNDLYEMSDVNTSEVIKAIIEKMQLDTPVFNVDRLSNYDQAKEQLFIRVSSAEKNKDLLCDVPHTVQEDLAITYHVLAADNEEGIASTVINNQMLENYGITVEQLHADALENSPKLFPTMVVPMSALLCRIVGAELSDFGISQEDVMSDNPMIVVTNEKIHWGAAAMFYPGQMEKIAEQLQGDFVIIPSSIHEMIVVPDAIGITADEILKMVTEINAIEVDPRDRLGDAVYRYDSKNHAFEKVR